MSVPVTGINIITIQLGLEKLNNVGDSITAFSSVLPGNATNKALNWSSSDTRYLNVINNTSLPPNGQVFAVANGVADIIATTAQGGFVARYTNFYVGSTAPVFVSGLNAITAAGSATSVALNTTLALSTSVTPANAFNKKINWYSSNTNVATVNISTGVVTPVSVGSVLIRAESANGGFVQTYALQVGTAAPSVNIIPPALSFTPGQTATFTATVSPNDPENPVVWTSSNPSAATINASGVVTAVANGTTTITATSGDISDSVVIVISDVYVPCFPAGTTIMTANGYKAVEDVKDNDMLLTADGRSVPVLIFTTAVASSTKESAPYTIPANTIMKGMPSADLRLSPWHAFTVGPNVWQKPAIASLYYNNITQDNLGEQVTYYHFEAPNYLRDNFIVAGTIVESFANKQLNSANPYTFHKDKAYFTRPVFNASKSSVATL